MDMNEAREKAAQAWCHPLTSGIVSGIVMDTVLCDVFAGILFDSNKQATAEVVALKAEIDSMSTSLIAKDKIISDVTFSNAILHWQVDRLTGERDSLIGAHDALLSDLAAMQSKRDALADTVKLLREQRDSLFQLVHILT